MVKPKYPLIETYKDLYGNTVKVYCKQGHQLRVVKRGRTIIRKIEKRNIHC